MKKIFSRHKNKFFGFLIIICVEIYLSFQFYSREPDFPVEILTIDVLNAVVRDIFLASILLFFRSNWLQIKQVAKEYRPIVIVATLWLTITLAMIHSLNLIFNPRTLIAVIAGVFNNLIFVLLAAYIYTKWNHLSAKFLYFLSYLLTLFIFYSDTIYFFITSSHIQKILFANLNYYSITSTISTADKSVLFAIVSSFLFLLFLFRTPKNFPPSRAKSISIMIIAICLGVNAVNLATAYTYPQLLQADGFDEESIIERSRNLSRELLSDPVIISLAREILRNDEKHVVASSQRQHLPFSKDEISLLDELGIDVNPKQRFTPQIFPYEKIIVIVAESFHRDYLHYYNPQIPKETTPFLDSLTANYPHSDHYYPSSAPTTQGLNCMFISQVLYSEEQSFDNNTTLFKTMANNGFKTMFLESTSQYYNDEFRAYKQRFGMEVYKAREDLERQGYTGSSGWGFHNDVMYTETINLLEQNRNNKFFLVTKTIDSHQPYPYCGFSSEEIPQIISDDPKNAFLKGIYWENITLQNFFKDLEKRNLLDDKTLVIVTSDHNPHPSQNSYYKRLGKAELELTLGPIPLIFVSKNLQPFKDFDSDTYASQIDFAPTLLSILGIPVPPEFAGRNMLMVPPEQSYAIGCKGETLYYRSAEQQIETDMYTGKNHTPYQKALIHWVEDLYLTYFIGKSVKIAPNN